MEKGKKGEAKEGINTRIIAIMMLLVIGVSTMIQGVNFIDNSRVVEPRVFGGFVVFSGFLLSATSIGCLVLFRTIAILNGVLANNIEANKEMLKVLREHTDKKTD